MNGNFIQLNRNLLHWEWYTETKTCRLFIHLLIRCNYEPSTWRGIEIKRGQFATSLSKLAAETGLSIQSVRTSLANMESTQDLTRYQHKSFTLIEINNYDMYLSSNTEATQIQHPINTSTNTQSTRQITTSNKDNKLKKVNKFSKPTIEEISEFMKEKEITSFSADKFFHYYESNGWKVGRSPMKSWQSSIHNWNARNGLGSSNDKSYKQCTPEEQSIIGRAMNKHGIHHTKVPTLNEAKELLKQDPK